MKFVIDNIDNLAISDSELFELLKEVYVQGGYITSELAETIFDPLKVRSRGILFAAREISKNEFSGMVIIVPPESSALVRAKQNECEMHLLGVVPKYRGCGLGRKLVKKALECVENKGWSKTILWTQRPMKEAQNLYESFGFLRAGEMAKNGIEFLVYERQSL